MSFFHSGTHRDDQVEEGVDLSCLTLREYILQATRRLPSQAGDDSVSFLCKE